MGTKARDNSVRRGHSTYHGALIIGASESVDVFSAAAGAEFVCSQGEGENNEGSGVDRELHVC